MPAKTLKYEDVKAESLKVPDVMAAYLALQPGYDQMRQQLLVKSMQRPDAVPAKPGVQDDWDALWAEALPWIIMGSAGWIAGALIANVLWALLQAVLS